jgi:DNA polymerase III subunit epsilon
MSMPGLMRLPGVVMGRLLDRRRTRLLRSAPSGPLRDYLSQPFPAPSTGHTDLRLLAVDLETTGLDPRRDGILSIGFVPVDGARITLAGARQVLVKATREVGQSAAIHGLTDDALAGGAPLEQALGIVLAALAERVLLAHHAAIERAFLSAACVQVFGTDVPFPSVDTMVLERRLLEAGSGHEPPPDSLRLQTSRDRRGLPRYRSHEAMTDALACAELYLAQVSALGHGQPVPLRRLCS